MPIALLSLLLHKFESVCVNVLPLSRALALFRTRAPSSKVPATSPLLSLAKQILPTGTYLTLEPPILLFDMISDFRVPERLTTQQNSSNTLPTDKAHPMPAGCLRPR